jgi:hypothetical protein
MLDFLMSEMGLKVLAGVVVAGVLLGLRIFFKVRQAEELFRQGVPLAYRAVLELSKHTENTVDDKIAMFLGAMNEWLGQNGAPPLAPAKVEEAKALFLQMHGVAEVK